MSSYSIQQQNVINQFRDTNNLGFVLSDDAVVELMLKEMEKTGRIYPGFEALARAAAKNEQTVSSQNIFSPQSIEESNPFAIEKTTSKYLTLTPTIAQSKAIEFLKSIVDDADNAVNEREKEAGHLSEFTNYLKEIGGDEYSRSNVKKKIGKSKTDLELLEQAARGEAGISLIGKTTPVSFEEMFFQRRGVIFDENAIQECEQKSEEFAKVKTSYDNVNQLKQRLNSATVGNLKSQMSPASSAAVIIEAFKSCGVGSEEEINKTLSDISEQYKDDPLVKKYGGDFRLGKNSQGKYVVLRTAKNGYPTEATNEELQLIVKELSSRLDKSFAEAIGFDIPQNTTPDDLSKMLSAEVAKYQKDYELSFAKAYGDKELKSLADAYIQKQQQAVANIEATLNIASMALMIVPGGAVATSGWLLKGATGLRTVKALQTINTAAKTMQGVQQAIALPLMAQMTLHPTELWEQLSSQNGMSKEEWEAWGQSVLQNTVYMAAGMGASKLAEAGAAYYKTKALVSTLKQVGKTTDDISAIVKANPVKFPTEVVKSLNKVDNLAKTLQVSTEVALDLTSTIAVNNLMNNGDLLPQDVIMSIGFALSGGVLQKQFMPLTTEAKIKFLQDAFKDVELSKENALNILKTMDDISAGRISVDDMVEKPVLGSDEQINLVNKANEELPMMDYGLKTPSEIVELKEFYSQYLTKEQLDIFIKLSQEEKDVISHLMFGSGMSFEDARFYYALPEEIKQKANILLNSAALGKVENYQELVGRVAELSETEIYSFLDIASWTKEGAGIGSCLDVIKSCKGDAQKVELMKKVALLNYDNQSLFTADDLLKIADSGADLPSVLKFFEKDVGYYTKYLYNLDKITFKDSSQVADFACLINEHNLPSLADFVYFANEKIDINTISRYASFIKDEATANDLKNVSSCISGSGSQELFTRFMDDYEKNPKITLALLDNNFYHDYGYHGFIEFDDEFTLNYISKLNSWTPSELVVASHKQFMENIQKYPTEFQEELKQLYLNKDYTQSELVTVSALKEADAREILTSESVDVLSVISGGIYERSVQDVYDLIKNCEDMGISAYTLRNIINPQTFDLVLKMFEVNKKSETEVFSGGYIEEILKTIRDADNDVEPSSIDNVLQLLKMAPEIKNEFLQVARLLSPKCSKYINKLDLDVAEKSPISVSDLYNKSFEKFSTEAGKFGCSTLAELELYLKTAKNDRAEVGKLVGRIKKDTLDSFISKLPSEVQNLVVGETGAFTANDLKNLTSRMNENSALRALFDVVVGTGGDFTPSINTALSTLILDSELKRRLWLNADDSNVKFNQVYATADKIYTTAFYPKMLELIKAMPSEEYEQNLAELNGVHFRQDVYEKFISASTILNEGVLSGIVHNNAPSKIWQILESLDNVIIIREREMWKEMFASKGLKDNEIQQMLSMVGSIDVDTLAVLKEKFYKDGRLDVAGMVNDCFSIIASKAGVAFSGEPDYSGWDLRYVPHILKAQRNLNTSDGELLNKIIEATFNGTYNKFLFDDTSSNGRANIATKKTYENEGLNFDTWMNFDKVHKFTFTPAKQSSNISNIIQSLENDIALMLNNEKLFSLVTECINKSGLVFADGKLLSKNGSELSPSVVSSLVTNLIDFSKAHGRELRDAKLLELRDHFAARQKGLRQNSTVGSEELTISLWKRDPKHDLFQGHFCGCCIALDGCNNKAIVHSLSHVVDNTIELKTSSGETIGKAKVLWMHDNDSGEPIFLVNGFEITGGKEYSTQIREEFLNFFKEYSKAVAGKEVMIVTANCSYQKVPIDDLKSYSSNINMLGTFPTTKKYDKGSGREVETQTYHLDTFQRQGSSWPTELEKAKDLTTKVMYRPADFGANVSKLRSELSTQVLNLTKILDAARIPYGDMVLNLPLKYKDVEVMSDNVKILSGHIQKLANPKDKEAEITFALAALFDDTVKSKVYEMADTIHKDADYIARDLTYEVTALFNDTNAPISIEKSGVGYKALYSETETPRTIGNVNGRAKSTDSVFSKIMNEILELQHSEADFYAFNKAVRDAYGFRIIIPDVTPKSVSEILKEAAQTHKDEFYETPNGIELEDALKGFYKDGFSGVLWKQMTPAQQQSVLDIAIEHKSQPFVDRLVQLINEDKVMVDKISNYVTSFAEKIPYLTVRQQMLISDAVSAKTGKPAVNYHAKPYSTRGSGYTAAQMNLKIWNYDTNVELQFRDGGVDGFAEKEHVPYDISENKITVRGKKYDEPRAVLNNLDTDGKELYKKFRSDVYTYYRLKALGVQNVLKPDITRMFAEAIADGQKVFKESPRDVELQDYLAILSEEGLGTLAH